MSLHSEDGSWYQWLSLSILRLIFTVPASGQSPNKDTQVFWVENLGQWVFRDYGGDEHGGKTILTMAPGRTSPAGAGACFATDLQQVSHQQPLARMLKRL